MIRTRLIPVVAVGLAGDYRGTRATAPSEGGFARFLVAAPLHD